MRRKFSVWFGVVVLLVVVAGAVWMFSGATSNGTPPGYVQPKIEDSYDVIVAGGEPEGVAAAVSAARNGAKTLLIEHRNGLGGLFTFGALNFLDVSRDMEGEFANAGIFKEWHDLVDYKIGFDIDKAERAFMQLVENEENLTLALNTEVSEAVKDGTKLEAVKIINHDGTPQTVAAGAFIDSTQDADLAVLAGVPYFLGGADRGLENLNMAVTLVLQFKNVDWDAVKKAADDGVFGGGVVDGNVGWGFSDLHFDYEPHHDNVRLRGLNIMQQGNGDVYINALQIFGVNGLDADDLDRAIAIGKKEAEYISAFLQKEFPGFENAELGDFPEELYVRETRHIEAEYQLPMSDIWENRDHWDSIGFGAYPVDIQATGPNDYGMVVSTPTQYAIPFRSLVPLEVDGLLVASKASGYSSVAAGSARVVPTGMTAAQAAGAAAAMAVEKGYSFRELSQNEYEIAVLQEKLVEQGARLYSFELPYPYEGEWFDPAVKYLMNFGLIGAGYDNVLPVDEPMNERAFLKILEGLAAAIELEATSEYFAEEKEKLGDEESIVTRDEAAQYLLKLAGKEAGADAWQTLAGAGILDDQIKQVLPVNRDLTGKEAYYLAYLTGVRHPVVD